MNFLYKAVAIVSALVISTTVFVQSSAAQDPKALMDQALVEGNSCKKVQLACQAAAISKKKDFQETCDRFKSATNASDEKFRLRVLDMIGKNDLGGAARFANNTVCDAGVKANLISQIDDAKKASAPVVAATPTAPAPKADQSPTYLGEARTSFSEGKLDAAVSFAKQVTDPNLKPYADEIVSKVGAYRSAVSAARSSEASRDYQGAINNWHTAQAINGSGPESPSSNIARLEPLARPAAPTAQPQAPTQVATKAPTPTNAAKQPAPPPVDINVQVGKLLDEANKAAAANQLQTALHGYENVLRLQASNGAAQAGKADIEKKINSDPAEQAKSLAAAIRDFYASKFPDAEDALRSYLDAPSAKSKGAAYFYLGATRLYEKILSSSTQKVDIALASAEVQRPFKDAHTAGYQPVERLVSPVVLRAWRAAQ